MPTKVKSGKEHFSAGGKDFNFSGGRIRVTKAFSTTDQADFKQGNGVERFTVLRWEFDQLDYETGAVMEAQEFTHVDFKVGDCMPEKPGKDKFHPGETDSATSDNVMDLGATLEIEGNTLVSMDSKEPAKTSKYGILIESLEDAGFNPAVLVNTYFPDHVGLECELENRKLPPDFYNNKKGAAVDPKAPKKDNYALAVVKNDFLKFPYDKKGGVKATTKPAANTKPTTTTAKTAATAPAKAKATGVDMSVLDKAIATVAKANKGQDVAFSILRRALQTDLVRVQKVDLEEIAPYIAIVDDPKQLTELVESVGGEYNADAEVATF